MPDLVRLKLRDHISILSGFPFPSENFSDREGMPLIRIRDLLNEEIETFYIGRYPDEFVVEDGEILVGMDGDFNVVRWWKGPALLNQRVCKVYSSSKELDQDFLYWLLGPELLRIHQRTPQTTVRHLSTRDLYEVEVEVPPAIEQNQVAQILDTLDTQIRQTEALIAKLERIKQGLLTDLLTRGIDENGQLRPPPEEAPHLYRQSPLGWIPTDWDIKPLEELAEVNRGKFTHRPRNDPAYYGGDFPFIQTGDVAAAKGGNIFTYSQTLSELGTTASTLFPKGTIAITIAANIADTAILGIPMYFPDSVVGAIVHDDVDIRYIELCIRNAKRGLNARAPQSAQKNINLQDLRPLPIPTPTPTEQKAIAQRYEALIARIRSERRSLTKLTIYKAGLMDDLLTGHVRVTPLLETAKQAYG